MSARPRTPLGNFGVTVAVTLPRRLMAVELQARRHIDAAEGAGAELDVHEQFTGQLVGPMARRMPDLQVRG